MTAPAVVGAFSVVDQVAANRSIPLDPLIGEHREIIGCCFVEPGIRRHRPVDGTKPVFHLCRIRCTLTKHLFYL